MEISSETEQREQQEDAEPALPPSDVAPRGRPFVKGQSGNPAGRPPRRAFQAAYVAEAMIDRRTVQLTRKVLELALAGDRMALRLCIERILPARREAPIRLALPPIEERSDVRTALREIAAAAAEGELTAGQAEAMARMLWNVLRAG